jgi:lysophospholipase L1-like esterase
MKHNLHRAQGNSNKYESQGRSRATPKAVVLGDSLLKFGGEQCKRKGYDVRFFPGIRKEELRHQVEKTDLEKEGPDVIVIHAGTNDIRGGISATKIMGDTMDLMDSIRKQVPETKIVISGILNRRNVSEHFISKINTELGWLCSVYDCQMVGGNCWIGKFDMARDGIHLNRTGAQKFGDLLSKVIHSCLLGNI